MRITPWFQAIRFCLAILCIAAVGSSGSVVAYQRGDASLPATESESDWADLGAAFFLSADEPGTTDVTGETYVLPSSGAEVVIGDGVSANDPAESDFEDQVIVTIPGGIGAIAVIQGLGYPAGVMEGYVSGFGGSMENVVEIDVQTDRFLATGLYQISLDFDEVYLFISVDAATSPGEHIIQVVVVGDDSLAESISLLRANVSINGLHMFADIDEHAIQDLASRHLED